MQGTHSMCVEVSSQWLNLNTLWKRPICELLQEWRKNLASLVFFIFLLINLIGVTLGTDTDEPVVVSHTIVWGGGGYASYSGIKGGITGTAPVSVAGSRAGTGFGGEGGVGARQKRDARRHDDLDKDKGRQSHHHSSPNNHSVVNNHRNNNNHNKVNCQDGCDLPDTSSLKDTTKDTFSRNPPPSASSSSSTLSSHSNLTDSTRSSPQCLHHTTHRQHPRACRTQHFISSICNHDRNENGQWTEDTLPFCNMILFKDTVDNRDDFCHNRSAGEGYVDRILEFDEQARSMLSRFQNVVLRHFDCRNPEVPRRWNCTDCENAYKEWSCAMAVPFYSAGQLIPPCPNYCRQAELLCPYLLPELDSQYMGQPSFLCTVPDIPHQPLTHFPGAAEEEANFSQCHQPLHRGGTSVRVPLEPVTNSRDINSSPNQTPSQSHKSNQFVQSPSSTAADAGINQTLTSSATSGSRTGSSSSQRISDNSSHGENTHKLINTDNPTLPVKQDFTGHGGTIESVSDNRDEQTNVELWDSSTSYTVDDVSTPPAGGGVWSLHGYCVKHRRHYMAVFLAQLFTVLFSADVFSIRNWWTLSAYT